MNDHDKVVLTTATLMVQEKMKENSGVIAIEPEKLNKEKEIIVVDDKRPRTSMKSTLMMALALTSAMNDFGGFDDYDRPEIESDESFNKRHTKKQTMNLTDEEMYKMASLSGKEKKKYVKELKEKYKA